MKFKFGLSGIESIICHLNWLPSAGKKCILNTHDEAWIHAGEILWGAIVMIDGFLVEEVYERWW